MSETKNCPICVSDKHSYPTTTEQLRECHARLRLIVDGLRLEVQSLKHDLKVVVTRLREGDWMDK